MREEDFIEIAKRIIKKEKRRWEFDRNGDVHKKHLGYDLRYSDRKTRKKIFVEVKGRSSAFKDSKHSNVSFEQTCYDFARKNPEKYYLVMVTT